ncbi:hypothetical protein OJ967_21425 [Peribacillus frigoritolerans]|uniref:hypothetical protein n=1 Tax=Peribacillus frigoritolerans TaxID=450367 RepID=UPI002225E4AF|nr:hypothetical protein [Peribacillus frigoritolerans]UYY97946.1 hypothetical protein OJ967_21425 [Peribacillus frigoritolerans]
MHTDNNLAAVNPALANEWHPTKNEKGPQDYFTNLILKYGGYVKSAVTNGIQIVILPAT